MSKTKLAINTPPLNSITLAADGRDLVDIFSEVSTVNNADRCSTIPISASETTMSEIYTKFKKYLLENQESVMLPIPNY